MTKVCRAFLLLIVAIFFAACSSPEPRHPISRKTHESIDASIALRTSINQSEIEAINQLIAKDSTQTYINSNKGFWYAYKVDNNNDYKPKFGDLVEYIYQIEDLDSKIIYSFDEIGVRTYAIDQQDLEEGLREAVKTLSEGEEAIFLFPSFKMHSFGGDRKKIRPLQSLKIVLKLLKINIKNENS
jgi:gliding motility-associated peptidyl-prolyl isomerase